MAGPITWIMHAPVPAAERDVILPAYACSSEGYGVACCVQL